MGAGIYHRGRKHVKEVLLRVEALLGLLRQRKQNEIKEEKIMRWLKCMLISTVRTRNTGKMIKKTSPLFPPEIRNVENNCLKL